MRKFAEWYDCMKDQRKKQAVAVIFSNVNLYDFLWYYATYGKAYEWTAVTEYYVSSDIELSKECERIGIFKKVIFYEVNTKHMSDFRKAARLAKAAAFYIVGKRDWYCKKLIAGCVDTYDLAVVANSTELLHGAFISQSAEKETVILEDGGADRKETFHKWKRSNGGLDMIYNLVNYLWSKMGYCDMGNCYELDTCRDCTKYALRPEQLKHRTYKHIFQIHDNTHTDMELLKRLIKNWCGDCLPEGLCAEAIIYTAPLNDIFENYEEIKHQVEEYVNENYGGKRVLLKKHPRDTWAYQFDDTVEVMEVPASVPAELCIAEIEVELCLFEFMSTVLDSYTGKKDQLKVFFFSGGKGRAYFKDYEARIKESCQIFRLKKNNIIRL